MSTKKPRIILVGAGGHARSCIDVIEEIGYYKIAGLIGVQKEVGDRFMGYKILGTDADLPTLSKIYKHAIITVGQIKTPDVRKKLFTKVNTNGFDLPSIVSPLSHVARHADLGRGTFVMHGVIINANAKIGDNCIINTNALIEHDAKIDAHCHISTGAIINGGSSVGRGSFIGSGSVIKQGIKVGSNCIVGMGVSVRHNLKDKSVVIVDKP